MTRMALAVDIGGTKLAAGIVTEDGELLRRAAAPTPADDGEQIFATLIDVVDSVRDGDEAVCGVGCGGPMARGGERVTPLNIPGWREFPLKQRLQHQLETQHVYIDNDAKALALGEGWVGAAKGETNFIAMVVSTGIGGGIVLDGQLLDGEQGNAGHIGHVIVEPNGRECGCGARGCLEAEASGTAIAAATGLPAEHATASQRLRVGTLVGRAVASAANLLDLKLAVVAGSVALGYGEPFFDAAQEEIDKCARLSFSRGAQIKPAGLADAGPLVGAAAVGWRGLHGQYGWR